MLDLLIVLAFVAYSVAVGFRFRRQASGSLEEYFLAGREVRGWRAGLSMAATQYAADTPLLVVGLVAVGGIFSLWRLWIYGVAFLLMAFVLARAWRRAGVLTDAELTEIRYSGRGVVALRALKAIYYGTLINCVVMAFVLTAATRIFEVFLPWHEWLSPAVYEPVRAFLDRSGLDFSSGATGLGPDVATANSVISIVAMLAFVAFYSTTGGLRSVIRTDVVQLGLMMVGTLAYAFFAARAAGGRDGMLDALAVQYGAERSAHMLSFFPTGGELLLPFLVVVSLQWFYQMNSDGTGYLAQRMMACADDREAQRAGVVFTVTQIVLRSLLWLPIAIALLVLYPFDPGASMTDAVVAARELSFAQGIDDLLPPGIRGLMLTGMLAALASTLDTHLNWGAGYWSNDLYKAIWVERVQKREARPRELVVVARLSNLLVLAIALAIMAQLGSIQTGWRISLLFGAGTGAVLVLRWLWERVNLYCEVAAIAVSLVVAPILIATVEREWVQLSGMAAASTVAVVLVALAGPQTEPERLQAFYRRTRPPGWWSRTAAAVGDDPRAPLHALARRLGQLLACAASVYGWLIGGGIWLLRPDEWPVAAACLIVGTLAVPGWWRVLVAETDGSGESA